jgi:hypothetical protein
VDFFLTKVFYLRKVFAMLGRVWDYRNDRQGSVPATREASGPDWNAAERQMVDTLITSYADGINIRSI